MPALSISRSGKWLILVPVIVLYAFVYNPWIKFPFTFLVITAAVLAWCAWQDRSLGSIGLASKGSLVKLIITVAFLFLGVEAAMDFIVQPVINIVTGEVADYSAFNRLTHQTGKYFKYVIYIWISAAFGEEIFFRGFLFRQLNKLLAGIKGKAIIISLISSILFALPHYYLGTGGMIITFLFGLVFSGVYIQSGYNLWIPILLHGLVDSLFITLAYFNKLEYYEFANKLVWGY